MSLQQDTYNLRQTIELTGISEFLLRIWENRYQAILPQRTPTGRRLYTTYEIEKISLLYQLTQSKQYRIGQISHYSVPQLKKISSQKKSTILQDQKQKWIYDFYKKIFHEDWEKARSILFKEISIHKKQEKIFKVILPLVQKMSELVKQQQLSITQEHIVTVYLKDILHSEWSHQTHAIQNKKLPLKFAFSTFEGDHHDLGILIARLLTTYHGIETLYLGPHIPSTEIQEICIKFNITHLLMTTTRKTTSRQTQHIMQTIDKLLKNTPQKLKLMIAGYNSHQFSYIQNSRFTILNSFDEFSRIISNHKQKELHD